MDIRVLVADYAEAGNKAVAKAVIEADIAISIAIAVDLVGGVY